MIFFLTTGSIMAISIFLIYRLCRFFHIDMKCSSLLLCAVLAFVVNGAAILMSPFLDKTHYLRLGLLVVIAAAFVTFYNERLLRREEAAAKTEPAIDEIDEVLDASPAVTVNPSPAQTVTADDVNTILAGKVNQAHPVDSDKNTAVTIEPKPAPAEQVPAEKAEKAAKEALAEIESESTSISAESPATIDASTSAERVATAPEPVTAKAIVTTNVDTADTASETEAPAVPVTNKAIATANADTADTLSEAEAAAEPLTALATAADTLTITAPAENYAAAVAKLETLDDLLDYAYDQRISSPKAAICAYKRAIEQYPNDDYMPFLIIELGNIYKNQADYHSTISIYAQALNMPVIAKNDATRQEFAKNLRYLGTVQDILSKHNALSTPFAEIPAPIMQEIEQVFQKRLAESS